MKLKYAFFAVVLMAMASNAHAVTPPFDNTNLVATQATPSSKFNALVITPAETEFWNNQLSIKLNSNLEFGKTYKLTVTCKATAASSLRVITKDTSTADKEEDLYLSEIKVGTDWDTYEATITPAATEKVAKVADDFTLAVGDLKDGTLVIKSISLVEDGTTENMIPNGDFASTDSQWYKRYGWHKFGYEVAQQTSIDLAQYSMAPIVYDYSQDNTPVIGGWGAGFKAEVADGALVWSHDETTGYWSAQAAFNQVFAKGGTYKVTLTIKGEAEGTISAELQNPSIDGGGYKTCGSFQIPLTTDYVEHTFDVKCTDHAGSKMIFNLGDYNNKVYVKSLKVEGNYFQEVLSVGESSFATYYAYYPVDYSAAGLTAYAVKLSDDKQSVTYNEIKGVVPAMTPVLVKGTPNTDYALEKADGEGQLVDTDLKVSAGYATTTVKEVVYGLATVEGKDGFYPAKAGVAIPAKLGFLQVAATAGARFYSIGGNGGTTGISQLAAEKANENATVYNLAGQVVGKGYKGIVIKNGKKMIQK